MNCPVQLKGEAKVFWDRHAARLEGLGILTDADLESFVILCRTWSMLQKMHDLEPSADNYREMIQLKNLQQQYFTFAKQFGLVPLERKRGKFNEGEDEDGEDDLVP